MRAYFVDNVKAEDVASRYGYTVKTIYSMVRDFKRLLLGKKPSSSFFVETLLGRKKRLEGDEVVKAVIELRKKQLSVPDIKAILDSRDMSIVSGQTRALLPLSARIIYKFVH